MMLFRGLSGMGPLVIRHHPDRSVAHLRRKRVRRLAHRGSIYSRVGASGKPGAVHRKEMVLNRAMRLQLATVLE